MSNLSEVLKFRGTWRSYQARVLGNSSKYLEDGKIHIVAAPGSGKTTLGIELIERIGKPVLILAPSVTIREQWKDRIVSAFLSEDEDPDKWISQSLRNPSVITIATYQALHSAMTRYSGVISGSSSEDLDNETEDTNDNSTDENVDFRGFDLVSTMKANGVGVICLDECHHLRSEWWKALEDYRSQMETQTVISLTATPPYDSTPAGWKRYIDMCGEIDEEITVPELVKEGSLCPHQDFIYFNLPTKEELELLDVFEEKCRSALKKYMSDEILATAIRGHAAFVGTKSLDEMLSEPAYLSALIIYMKAKGYDVPKHIESVMGTRKFPKMNEKWMEIVLQKFLIDCPDDFPCPSGYQELVAQDMRKSGLINKRKVTLTASAAVEKMLISSKGKIKSILTIAESEYQTLGNNLRMLVLTDFIRREQESSLGSSKENVDAMGVLPFFEAIRTHFEKKTDIVKPKLAVLCGTVVIIPAEAREELIKIASEDGNEDKLSFGKVGQLNENEYVKVISVGSSNFLTSAVTELFTRGFMHIVIGTKSLLGEGWDSPCINSLILASFVGSFMLSNQMRGRAIRTMKGNPDKNSNIWHLVCVKPPRIIDKERAEGVETPLLSDDWEMLVRRMDHFMGLHYSEDIIENGIDRLSCIEPDFSENGIKKTNLAMMKEASRRNELKERWNRALSISKKVEVVDETDVTSDRVGMAVFTDTFRMTIFFAILLLLTLISSVFLGGVFGLVGGIVGMVFLVLLAIKIPKLIMLRSPAKRLKLVGEGMLKAMKMCDVLPSKEAYRVGTAELDAFSSAVYLVGGSARDKNLFSNCVQEFLAPVENQRYLLVHPKNKRSSISYYCVPEVFANNKEKAALFKDVMSKSIGKYDLVYTRNAEGRKILLKGRTNAYANRQEACLGKRRVKSALE